MLRFLRLDGRRNPGHTRLNSGVWGRVCIDQGDRISAAAHYPALPSEFRVGMFDSVTDPLIKGHVPVRTALGMELCEKPGDGIKPPSLDRPKLPAVSPVSLSQGSAVQQGEGQ